MTEIRDWLETNAHGFSDLVNDEVSAISDFSLLWSLFEARILDTKGSTSAICKAVDAWQKAGKLNAQSLDSEFAYFQQRYFANGGFTYHFEKLRFRGNDNDKKALVRDVIDGGNNDPRDRVVAILIIIFRIRNNLFHGVKWQDRFAGQLDNFNTANAVLMKVLDEYGALAEG